MKGNGQMHLRFSHSSGADFTLPILKKAAQPNLFRVRSKNCPTKAAPRDGLDTLYSSSFAAVWVMTLALMVRLLAGSQPRVGVPAGAAPSFLAAPAQDLTETCLDPGTFHRHQRPM